MFLNNKNKQCEGESKQQVMAVLEVGEVLGNGGDCGDLDNTYLVSGGIQKGLWAWVARFPSLPKEINYPRGLSRSVNWPTF